MKILRITTYLDFGGQEKQYISFTNSKNNFKYSYVFASIGKGGYSENDIRQKGFDVKVFNENPSFMNLKFTFILYKWLKKLKPDLVHTAAGEANFHGIIAAKLAGVKFVVAEEIGFPNHSVKARIIFSFLYRFVNRVVCVSNAVKNYLIKLGEISSETGYVIYNPVSKLPLVKRTFQPYFTIVTVGRLDRVKNQNLLIEAIANFKNEEIKLIIVGDGPDRKYLEKQIIRFKLENQVLITGFIPDPEHYLAKADLFVLPSISEGFGIAVIEAMQFGIPCLCTNVGGISEFITDAYNGWLFDPNNKNEFQSKLKGILEMDSDLRKKVAFQGMNSVEKRFTELKYVENVENLYHSIFETR
ncbi:glycosyltransferase [Cyclobacterium amurskyense]|uniref:Glycosyl transferase group 1 n=1 Tax=Cyclobacterium amurskyense TaxID=320787 RepID=A0A0H4PJC0_9BACT|nr:glycosyltransferase [Cyclobacterium amurskyense]AKP53018.1 hypothetical protein CA2015_3641 [Cyclobacterium amurskyense]